MAVNTTETGTAQSFVMKHESLTMFVRRGQGRRFPEVQADVASSFCWLLYLPLHKVNQMNTLFISETTKVFSINSVTGRSKLIFAGLI
jgi:hypothetical protein